MRATLSSVFKFAVNEQEYLDNNPVKRVASLKEDNKIVRYLSDEERKALIQACKESEWNGRGNPSLSSKTGIFVCS
jgi:site-specific recombinase XerD